MSTFSQWWLSFKKSGQAKQITWLCGNEPVLVDEVVDLLKGVIPADAVNTVHLDAREQTPRYIWNELRQYPFGQDATRLTIVYGAEDLPLDEDFIQYIKDRGALPRNYVIFVSSEDQLRKKEDNARSVVDALEYLKGRGAVIECRPFTASTAKHAVTWVKEKAELRGRVAEYILNRATGDLRLVRDTLNKLKVIKGDVSLRLIDEMFEAQPDDTFLGALFALDRKTALAVLQEMPRSEYSRTIGLVDARLDLAGLVHDMLIQQKSSGEIAKAAGNKGFLVPDMLPVAKHYDKKRRLRIRKYLATVDSYSQYGVPEGALEALVAIW
jgi:DNA polymerase III delta subunit